MKNVKQMTIKELQTVRNKAYKSRSESKRYRRSCRAQNYVINAINDEMKRRRKMNK